MSNQQEKWEEEFERRFPHFYIGYPQGTFADRIKSFIRNLLQQQREGWIKTTYENRAYDQGRAAMAAEIKEKVEQRLHFLIGPYGEPGSIDRNQSPYENAISGKIEMARNILSLLPSDTNKCCKECWGYPGIWCLDKACSCHIAPDTK